jgi:hypothetical protein
VSSRRMASIATSCSLRARASLGRAETRRSIRAPRLGASVLSARAVRSRAVRRLTAGRRGASR